MTGARASELRRLLNRAGMPTIDWKPRGPRLHDLDNPDTILALYHQDLGGILDDPALAPRGWDINAGGLLVELDEEQHFNRYRALTLTTGWANQLPWTEPYRMYCATSEQRCLRDSSHQGYWTRSSAERQFGPAAPRGDLTSPLGAPRWKQRALYDTMRDAYVLAGTSEHRLARVSIYDNVAGHILDDILNQKASCDPTALRDLIRARTLDSTGT